ncbi:MAG: RNA polymerase factor sigma-32 [Deltaproteobacteria bacterium]|nr:RNA polymerase factor sigma-32 [Deltaproteobacteria bacterium]
MTERPAKDAKEPDSDAPEETDALEAELIEAADDADEPSDGTSGDLDGDSAVTLPAAREFVLPKPAGPSSSAVGPVDAFTRYTAELAHHAPISREEEHELAVRYQEHGDRDAAEKLVLSNLRLVVKIAMQYRRAWTQALDLIQEGNVGLVQAVERFDPYAGTKLSTYAAYWIRAYVLKFLLDNIRMVRLGTTRAQRKLFFRLNKEKRALEAEGFAVEPKRIAERLDVSEADVVDMEQRLGQSDLSMEAPARRDETGGATFGDFVPSSGASAEERVADGEIRKVFLEQVGEFVETLDERERQIVDERLLANEPKTLAQLGEEFGVTRERVRQLEKRVVDRLREHLRENLVDFEVYSPGE